jgi:hypothetical protein
MTQFWPLATFDSGLLTKAIMRHSQRILPRRQKGKLTHSSTISFRCLDRALGVVSDLHSCIGNDSTARIGNDASQSARSRCLSIQFIGQTGNEQKDYKEQNHGPKFHGGTPTIPVGQILRPANSGCADNTTPLPLSSSSKRRAPRKLCQLGGSAHNLSPNRCAITQNKAGRTNRIDFLQLPWAQESSFRRVGSEGFKTALSSQTLRCRDKNKKQRALISYERS